MLNLDNVRSKFLLKDFLFPNRIHKFLDRDKYVYDGLTNLRYIYVYMYSFSIGIIIELIRKQKQTN